jgi:hypothetical protein
MTDKTSSDFSPLDVARSKRPRFDPTINLGHLLTFAGFMLAGFGAWATLDKRLVVLEENRRTQAAIDSAQDARYEYGVRQLQNQLDRVETKLDRIIERR